MKKVVAVPPYVYKGVSNFKYYPFLAWQRLGGEVKKCFYPPKSLHGLIYRTDIPSFFQNKKEARLKFVSGYSINFDTFPDYVFYEVIPVIWDCWPMQIDSVSGFFRKHQVRTAIFTSSQTADAFRNMFPQMNVLTITEGIDISLYAKGNNLRDRKIDILEVGRKDGNFFKTNLPEYIYHVNTGNFDRVFKTDEEFRAALADTKVTVAVPRCDVDKRVAGDIETLTQRYWECMLSRILIVGRAPKELIDLIGYNPVIDWDGYDATPQVTDILENINEYQELVDKNYETAINMASWDIRILQIMDYLRQLNYLVK